jgi:hypothetical protein
MAFVVYGKDPEVFLGLITSTPKTIIQTGQLGAIILADALVVQSFLVQPNVIISIIYTPRSTVLGLCGITTTLLL